MGSISVLFIQGQDVTDAAIRRNGFCLPGEGLFFNFLGSIWIPYIQRFHTISLEKSADSKIS